MKKKPVKLKLSRETLHLLDGAILKGAAGGNPSSLCNTDYPCTSVDRPCGGTGGARCNSEGCPTGVSICVNCPA